MAQAHAAPAISAARQTIEEPVQAAATVDQDFAGRLQHVANDYLSYALIDRLGHWAPELCLWSPTPKFSEAAPDAPHAQKIYFLFAKDPDSYEAPETTQPVGQAIVKQSWSPKEVSARATADAGDDETNRPNAPYASRDGKVYRGDHQTGLFIMLKLDPETPETDEGWIYGTVMPDGKKVTSAGRVASCMECHQQTKGDRVFGIKRDDLPASSLDD
ncbi:MAG TPA: cytochrome P460 family protein [Pirellulales bacterium]